MKMSRQNMPRISKPFKNELKSKHLYKIGTKFKLK